MTFAKCLAVLAAGGLLIGATGAIAGGTKDRDLVKVVDADLKRIDAGFKRLDKELFGWMKRDHKR
jgi:hypothetical protein